MRFILSVLLTGLLGCSPSNPAQDGSTASDAASEAGASCTPVADAPSPTSLLMGAYTATTDVSAEQQTVAAISAIRALAAMSAVPWWDMIEPMVGEGSPAVRALRRADELARGASGAMDPESLEATFRAGLREARAATTDGARATAKQRTEKPLLSALGVLFQSDLATADEAARRGCLRESLAALDRAATHYGGLDANYRSRGSIRVMGVWGTGRDTLADENMGDAITGLLGRARTAAAGGSATGLRAVAGELRAYGTKYFFLSTVLYGGVVADAVGAGSPTETPQVEGTLFADGLLYTIGGSPADRTTPAATALRALWRGPAASITRIAALRASSGLFLEALERDLAGFTTSDRDGQLAVASRAVGLIEALDEPLGLAGQDPAALRAKAAEARAAVASGDAPRATARLNELRDAVRALTTLAPTM